MSSIHYLFPQDAEGAAESHLPDLRGAHPKVLSLFEFWLSRCGERRFPKRSDFDVMDFAPWMGNLSLVELIDEGRDYRYRVHGTNKADYLGRDLTGRCVSELPLDQAAIVREEYDRVVSSGVPHFVNRPHINGDKDFLRTNKLMLPLSKDMAAVEIILVGLYSWFGRISAEPKSILGD